MQINIKHEEKQDNFVTVDCLEPGKLYKLVRTISGNIVPDDEVYIILGIYPIYKEDYTIHGIDIREGVDWNSEDINARFVKLEDNQYEFNVKI